MVKTADMKVKVIGGVKEPHEITEPFADPLPAGDVNVKVLDVQDENPEQASKHSRNWEVQCEYPDGFIANHQVPKTSDTSPEEVNQEILLLMIRNKLRGRHGIPHGNKPAEGNHGLNHIAGELLTPMPKIRDLAGVTLTFAWVG